MLLFTSQKEDYNSLLQNLSNMSLFHIIVLQYAWLLLLATCSKEATNTHVDVSPVGLDEHGAGSERTSDHLVDPFVDVSPVHEHSVSFERTTDPLVDLSKVRTERTTDVTDAVVDLSDTLVDVSPPVDEHEVRTEQIIDVTNAFVYLSNEGE